MTTQWKTDRIRAATLALALLPLAACGGAAPEGGDPGTGTGDPNPLVCDFEGPAQVVLGGGTQQTGFLTLQDGADMTGSLGPQGLYMITPSVRAKNVYPGKGGSVGDARDPEIVVEAYLGQDLVGGSAQARMGLTMTPDGGERLGIWVPFNGRLDEYVGKTVVLMTTVADACGQTVTDELEVVIRQ